MTDQQRMRFGALPMGNVTHVMGVINLSPESRNGHTVATTPKQALEMARRYTDAGATLLDVGAQSSHYENPTISPDEELDRLLPALELLVGDGFLVSVDTWKPEVAAAAIAGGAVMINDTGGLGDQRMRELLSGDAVAAVVMYLEGENPHAVGEIAISDDKTEMMVPWFEKRLALLADQGLSNLILDPGIAINYRGDYSAYTRMQIEVIRRIKEFRCFGYPILVPVPRKAEDHRVVAYITLAVESGADLIRVHDVEWACDLVRLLGRDPRSERP